MAVGGAVVAASSPLVTTVVTEVMMVVEEMIAETGAALETEVVGGDSVEASEAVVAVGTTPTGNLALCVKP